MRGLLADVNCEGHVDRLVRLMEAESRREVWEYLQLQVFRFSGFDLRPETPDRDVWILCQEEQLSLVTANRNAREDDSLEAAIRELNDARCLPVFTISNPVRLKRNAAYANRIADKFLEYLFDIDRHLGVGRIYLS
ncbi:MAG TPA: hypothetical protein VML55_06625 [Planctomycetaceae bacterium]|nr:hypothetical protein [Planctomycetaceae bacterium]